MGLFLLPIGTIIVSSMADVPHGWRDITGSFECMEQIEHFHREHPNAGEFLAHDPLFCIKKVVPEVGS